MTILCMVSVTKVKVQPSNQVILCMIHTKRYQNNHLDTTILYKDQTEDHVPNYRLINSRQSFKCNEMSLSKSS